MPVDANTWRTVVSALEAHPWALAGYFALVILLKLLFVARGDVATAAMILGADGFASLTSVVALVAIPGAALACFLTAIIVSARTLCIEGRKEAEMPIVLTLLVGLAAMVFLPFITVLVFGVIALVFGFVYGALSHWHRKCRGTSEKSPDFVMLLGIAATAGLIASAFQGGVWMPVERIDTAHREAMVGYVVSSDGDEAVIMLEESRTTVTIDLEDVKSRARCQLKPPLFEWKLPMGRPGEYPNCFESQPGK